MNLLNKVPSETFNELIKIRFDNINTGFNNFNNGILEPIDNSLSIAEKEQLFLNFFRKALALNNSFATVDFYLKNLNSSEILNLLNSLDHKEKLILLDQLKACDNSTIYFTLANENLMDFITILNVKNLFFCTVYFKEFPLTIWGNYDFKFPVFFEDKDILDKYNDLAKECNLNILNCIYIK